MNLKKSFLVLSILSLNLFNAQSYKKPLVSAITEKDLRTDMYQMAADQFWGREAGTLDELKVSMWFADKMKEQKFLLFFISFPQLFFSFQLYRELSKFLHLFLELFGVVFGFLRQFQAVFYSAVYK